MYTQQPPFGHRTVDSNGDGNFIPKATIVLHCVSFESFMAARHFDIVHFDINSCHCFSFQPLLFSNIEKNALATNGHMYMGKCLCSMCKCMVFSSSLSAIMNEIQCIHYLWWNGMSRFLCAHEPMWITECLLNPLCRNHFENSPPSQALHIVCVAFVSNPDLVAGFSTTFSIYFYWLTHHNLMWAVFLLQTEPMDFVLLLLCNFFFLFALFRFIAGLQVFSKSYSAQNNVHVSFGIINVMFWHRDNFSR